MIPEPLLLFLHIASAVVWVGGMFFAYLCLRPVAGQILDGPSRLRLWRAVFERFFRWVWVAVLLILATGGAMMARTGFAAAPPHWHLMAAIGVAMAAIFVFVFFGPYPALRRSVDGSEWPAAAAALNRIRQAVAVNLVLGLANVAVATLGRLLA